MATPSHHPVEVTVPEVRELATAWARDLDVIAAQMYEFLADRIPEATADDEISALTLASCSSNVEAVLSMIRHGISASATEAPVAALEHARRMAARGGSMDATLRFYRLGHAYFWERFSADLVAALPDRDRLVVAMRETAAFMFDYIDSVSARVGTEHIAERERRQRRAALLRADVTRSILAGEKVDRETAERTLGHPLTGTQLALVCWTDGDPGALEKVALAVARTAGVSRPLLLADGPRVLGAWLALPTASPPDLASLRAVAAEAAPDAHVALGEPSTGIEGFRRSRDQADRARRAVGLTQRRAPTFTSFTDVALVDLLTGDLAAAKAFVRNELGALAAADVAAARAREAMLWVVAPHGGLATAARELGLHRNTVLQRVRRGEQLRGAPTTQRPAELHAALLLAAVFGADLHD